MSNKRKITFISSVTTPERAYENIPELKDFDVKFFPMHESSKRILAEAPDTEFIIADAGLDVISQESVLADNILLSPDIKDRLALTPHIAGITSLTVKKLYRQCFENIIRVINNEEPINIVL